MTNERIIPPLGPADLANCPTTFEREQDLQPGATRDAADTGPRTEDWPDDSVIEVELGGGIRLRTTREQFVADFAPSAERGAKGKSPLPERLAVGAGERGLTDWAVAAYRLFRPGKSIERHLVEIAAGRIELQVSHRLGLRGVNLESEQGLQALDRPAGEFDPNKPILVFLHGTASSTTGSFGELWTPAQTAMRLALHKDYGNNVAAFEHRTLTESPIQNAITLVKALPPRTPLHLVSHSRGGLIGELLCRSGVLNQAQPFAEDDIQFLESGTQQDELRELNRLLHERSLRIDRFIRVACPARGTTLASRRLDLFFSALANLLRITLPLGGTVSATVEALLDFAGAVAKERTNPASLPGLQAMMPESGFIRMLNRPGLVVTSDLTVLAGDAEGEGVLRQLGLLLFDLFYREDHDFVVNTRSMYGGAARSENQARFFFDQGTDVNHFHYFRNTDTTRRLLSGLQRSSGYESGFATLGTAAREIRLPARRGSEPARPPLLVLPGIMGSQLGIPTGKGIDLVWLNYLNLARGGLPDRLNRDATGVVAAGPLPNSYGRLLEYLHLSHEVVPFGYDWRRSLRDEAARLAGELENQLNHARREGQPVRLLAHSMGGLLFRTLIQQRPELWSRMLEHPDSRVVLLGTPFQGSHAITRLLCGQEPTLKALSLLDLRHSQRELLQTIAAFPGVLELLPDDRSYDYFRAKTWRPIADAVGAGFVTPDPTALAAAMNLRLQLDDTPLDPGRIVYVAGLAAETPTQLDVVPDGKRTKVVFQRTGRGDGRVPWATIPAGLPVYYLPEAHGDLADHEPSFLAIQDLLTAGRTNRLSTQPPALTRDGAENQPMREESLPFLPDTETLEQVVRGGARRRQRTQSLPQIHVEVVHGNLRESKAPVLVGHYIDDALFSAESVLDRMHEGRLRGLQQMGLYPGSIGTAEVFLRDDRQVPGAIVVGLGPVGELRPGDLVTAVASGLQRYAAIMAERPSADRPVGITRLPVTVLLVGTTSGGFSIADAVLAILRGTRQAAAVLRQSRYGSFLQYAGLAIMELYEDRAIQAAHELRRLAKLPEFQGEFTVTTAYRTTETGWRRAWYQESPGWWGRLQVTEEPDRSLKFVTLTDRAQAPVIMQALQRPLIDRFVQEAIQSVNTNTALCQTLFDLLLPLELKSRAPEQTNLVLVVDEAAARYPWELMRDRLNRSDVPLVVERGLIRQLQTKEYRPGVHNARTSEALVIGDPVSQFPTLPGAQAEADTVAKLLQQGGARVTPFSVTTCIQANATEIMNELFARDYRILHLAGHGVYRYPVTDATADKGGEATPGDKQPAPVLTSGMVLGDGVFLTPVEVSQMRSVPELVFLNCCHLGLIEANKQKNLWYEPHKLAANLATEFIRMGVRAVLASGWAVHDGAGLTFSRTFYQQMLSGASFGEAVQVARREAWVAHPGVNTWGAFQCYGNPDYQLSRGPGSGSAAPGGGVVSPAEVIAKLENLRSQSRDSEETQQAARFLDRVEQNLKQGEWAGNARLRMALGLASHALGRLEQAREHLLAAVASESPHISLEAIEKLANTEVKLAGSTQGRSVAARRALAGQAIGRLKQLIDMAPNRERHSLLGSAFKRVAQLESNSGQKRLDAMKSMQAAYAEASAFARRTDSSKTYYPLLNAFAARLCAAWLDQAPGALPSVRAALDETLAEARKSAAEEASAEPSFWNRVTEADCELLTLLVTPKRSSREAVVTAYLDAARRGLSKHQQSAVEEHLEFLLGMAKAGKRTREVALLEYILAELRRHWG